MSGLREALEELIEKAGDQRSMPLLVPVRVVPVAALRQLLDAYPEEGKPKTPDHEVQIRRALLDLADRGEL